MDSPRTLGQVIRTRRQALGLTQEQLAERIGDGVRQAEVSRLECDRVALPRRRRLERIAFALELPIGQLLATAGWSGAEAAFARPADVTSLATTEVAAPHEPVPPVAVARRDDLSDLRHDMSSVNDLRQAMIRSQELHWQTLQLLQVSNDLAQKWIDGRSGIRSSEAPTTTG